MFSDEFLEKLRDLQYGQGFHRPHVSYSEWRQDQDFRKANRIGPGYNPGVGMSGRLGTSSFAPTGLAYRRSGEQAVGLKNLPQSPQQFGVPAGMSPSQGQSKYSQDPPPSPPPWIDDVDMANIWYSPMEPVWPFGPPYYNQPREWNFPVGYNLNYIPQRMAMFGMLRGMRQSWGMLATIEATRMDQLLRVPWTIQRRDKPRATSPSVQKMREFFRRPDGKLSYSQWVRKLLFDLFDIDAPAIYIDRQNGLGEVRHAQVLDGATIFPLIDDTGRRPDTDLTIDEDGITYLRRQPAFQQIIYGLPMINLSENEMVYAVMRPRPELPMFGYSPIEQIFTEAIGAIRKTLYQTEFWRSNSIPEMMITVPEQWTPRQIATFQAHFDAVLSGNLALKSKVRFVPGGMKPFEIKNASGQDIWSHWDEMMVRLACYAFSVSPTPFIQQNNRATAQTAQQTSEGEGLYPLMSWFKDDIMDRIIQQECGFDDIEFVYLPRPEVDGVKQAQIHKIQVDEGLRTRNEIREELGQEPYEEGGDVPTITTGAGVIPLAMAASGQHFAIGAGGGQQTSLNDENAKPEPTGDNKPQNSPVRGAPRSEPGGRPTEVHKISYAQVTDAAKEATKPTKKQKKVGNYKKGHFWLQGLDITIETPKGKHRKGHEGDGTPWKSKMAGHYGYIRGTLGADGEHIDTCVGRHPKSPFVFVIDQYSSDTGKFDEHKVFLGYRKSQAVMDDYFDSNGDGLGPKRLGAMVALSMDEFKQWLADGDHEHAIARQGYGTVVARRGELITKMDTISTSTNLSWRGGMSVRKPKKTKKRRRQRAGASGPRWLELAAR